MRLIAGRASFFGALVLLVNLHASRGAVRLDALGVYLTKNGYGGAQLVHIGNFYHLPVKANGKPGNLLVDTGSPTSLIFRSSVKRLNFAESRTTERIDGAFGRGRDVYGRTIVQGLIAGNCILTDVPVAIAAGTADSTFTHPGSNGLLGLLELVKFGAVLDLRNHLLYLRPSRPGENLGAGIRSILTHDGYTAVQLLIRDYHLCVAGALNGVPCSFIVDTGGYVTALDLDFTRRVKLKVAATPLIGESFGGTSAFGITTFPSLRIGGYEIKNGSASVARLNPQIIRSHPEIAGLIGAEYLGINRAIFDFVSGTMFLRPPPR